MAKASAVFVCRCNSMCDPDSPARHDGSNREREGAINPLPVCLQVDQMFANVPLGVAGNLDDGRLHYVITHAEDKEQDDETDT